MSRVWESGAHMSAEVSAGCFLKMSAKMSGAHQNFWKNQKTVELKFGYFYVFDKDISGISN